MSPDLAHFDLATAPAHAADAQADAAVEPDEAFREHPARIVLDAVRDIAGVTVTGRYSFKSDRVGEGYVIALVHNFSDPAAGEADLVVLANGYPWSRPGSGPLSIGRCLRSASAKCVLTSLRGTSH